MIEVFLEVGARRTFAGVIDWPGWCRSGRDEPAAVAALIAAGPRYARAVRAARLGFRSPVDASKLVVAQRVKGTPTTDFGAPDQLLKRDVGPLASGECRRLQAILRSCWRAFDAACEAAEGHALRKGPRGGGRDLHAIRRHVLEAEVGYLARLGRSVQLPDAASSKQAAHLHQAILDALSETADSGTPPRGPRGGGRWHPRQFTRRVAWHVLDHAWEIEDRLI